MKGTSSGSLPFCAKCKLPMTPENSKLRPELFLCDACLPVELKPNDLGMKPEVSAADFAYPRCAGCKEVIAANEHNVINDRGRFHVKCAPGPQWSEAGKEVEESVKMVRESLGLPPLTAEQAAAPRRKVFETIRGLTLDVPGPEIIEHCRIKADHYRTRAEEHRQRNEAAENARQKTLQKLTADPLCNIPFPPTDFFTSYIGPPPAERLKFFEFTAAHVSNAAVYRLSLDELKSLEWFW